MNSSVLESIDQKCRLEFQSAIKQIKETNQPLKSIDAHNCNLSTKQRSQFIEQFFITNYSLDELAMYTTKTIAQAVNDGALIMPRNNKMADLWGFLFENLVPFETLKRSRSPFYKTIRETLHKLRFSYTAKALISNGTYSTSHATYNPDLCSDETLASFKKCVFERRPMNYISSMIKSRAQGNSFSFLIETVLPLFSDEEWIEYICSTMRVYYTNASSKIHLGKETLIKTLFGRSVFNQYYALKQNPRFSLILGASILRINTTYLYISDEVKA